MNSSGLKWSVFTRGGKWGRCSCVGVRGWVSVLRGGEGGGASRKGMPNCAQSLADHLHWDCWIVGKEEAWRLCHLFYLFYPLPQTCWAHSCTNWHFSIRFSVNVTRQRYSWILRLHRTPKHKLFTGYCSTCIKWTCTFIFVLAKLVHKVNHIMLIMCPLSGTYWLYTKKNLSRSLCIPSLLRLWQGNGSSSIAESSYGIRTTEAWLALNEGTNCRARRRARNQQWHMGGGPRARSAGQASLPTMWTGKVCELLPCLAQSIIQQMEHISHTAGERLAGVGVGEHLTQAPFVLWARVRITVRGSCRLQFGRWVGHCGALGGEDHAAGTITTSSLWCSD